MIKSHKARSPLAAALAAGTLCVGPGCASAPQTGGEPPPPPIPCPAGAAQTYKLHHTVESPFVEFEHGDGTWRIIRDGEVLRVTLVSEWGDLQQDKTFFTGRAWFGGDRVYGRLTQMILSSGERQPVCLDLNFNGPGVPMMPGSTRTVARVTNAVLAKPVPETEAP